MKDGGKATGDKQQDDGYAGYKQGFDNADQFYNSQKNKLKESILIDFFLTVGLPKSIAIDILEHIEKNLNGDFTSEETW